MWLCKSPHVVKHRPLTLKHKEFKVVFARWKEPTDQHLWGGRRLAFKLQSGALTDGFSTISSGLLKNKNDFKTLPSEPECYIHLFVKTSVICWLVFCRPPPPSLSNFVSFYSPHLLSYVTTLTLAAFLLITQTSIFLTQDISTCIFLYEKDNFSPLLSYFLIFVPVPPNWQGIPWTPHQIIIILVQLSLH